MTDERTGKTYNYSSVPGLLCSGMVNSKGSAAALWNAVEARETRINARVARELRPALPVELPLEQQRRLVHGYANWLKDEFGVAVHYVIHAPTFRSKEDSASLWRGRKSPEGLDAYLNALSDPAMTNLNFHAHIRFTTRTVDRETGVFGDKTRELDDLKTGPVHVTRMRDEWQKRTNAALAKAGSKARIDLRSYEAMAADGDAPEGLTAQRHLGPRDTARARRLRDETGVDSSAAGRARTETAQTNDELWMCWQQLRHLGREKARLEGVSARIAEEREAARRKDAEIEQRRIADATDVAARQRAIDAAKSVDMPREPTAWEQAVAWAADAGGEETEVQPEFEQVIDPETYEYPDTQPALLVNRRAKQTVRVRQRTRSG